MLSYSLNGDYTLYYADEQLCPLDKEDMTAIPAVVPGNVEIDLMRAGVLPDIFFGNNVKLLRPYEFYMWHYVRSFNAPALHEGQSAFLHFHGVDCFAEFYLNGELFAVSDNALIDHRFEVTEELRAGENTLDIVIHSPILESAKLDNDAATTSAAHGYEALRVRKAPSAYGWDIMPRTVSAGIWRGVELEIEEANEITGLYLATTEIRKNQAAIICQYKTKTNVPFYKDMTLRLRLLLDGEEKCVQTVPYEFVQGRFRFLMDDPELWWPNGYGKQPIYDVVCEMLQGDQVLATYKTTFGIRTVKLVRSDVTDTYGGEFCFVVNGVKIFCKGSNWVPADAMHSRDASRYEKMLALWKDTNCNILRCWGGNVYEDHAFFDICDRMGIMVWQDFTMACGCYPSDENFLEDMRYEAESVVTKLRNHPSIILYSGDNECDECAAVWGSMTDPDNSIVTRQTLPRVIARLDPYRPYLPSSPYYSKTAYERARGNTEMLNQLLPERHLWGPRDYYKSTFYTQATCHFASETGYHGCNSLSSMRNFLHEDKLWPWQNNDEWLTHASEMHGENGHYAYRIKLMSDQIHEMFGEDMDNLEDFILASQLSQAEAKKFFIELTRCNKWRRTGVIWWNIIDGWPQFSDAVVSYDFIKKLAYYYIKRSQQDICLMLAEPENWHIRLMAGNDTLITRTGTYRVWDGDTGEVVSEGTFTAEANSTTEIDAIRISHGDQRLFLMEWEYDGIRSVNHYVLGMPPLSFARYKKWLPKIAELDHSFDPEKIGK